MRKVLKLAHININNIFGRKLKCFKLLEGFTLLEVLLAIVIMGIFIGASFGFLKYNLEFFNREEADLLSSTEEKIALNYLSRDIIPASEIELFDDKMRLFTFFKGERINVIYKLYDLKFGQALGKKTGKQILPVINNIKKLDFSKEDKLLRIEFTLINNRGEERKIIKFIMPRIEDGGEED